MTLIKKRHVTEGLIGSPHCQYDLNRVRTRYFTHRGGTLVEVLVALVIFMSTSTYLLSSKIDALRLWQATLDKRENQTLATNAARLAYTQDNVEQHWGDIAIFGIPTPRLNGP